METWQKESMDAAIKGVVEIMGRVDMAVRYLDAGRPINAELIEIEKIADVTEVILSITEQLQTAPQGVEDTLDQFNNLNNAINGLYDVI